MKWRKDFLMIIIMITDTAAIEKIDVDYDKTLLKLFFGNTDNFPFVFAKSDVDAEDMSIFVHLAPKDRNTMEVIFKGGCFFQKVLFVFQISKRKNFQTTILNLKFDFCLFCVRCFL